MNKDSHARDNKLHVWRLPIKRGPTSLGGSAALPGLPTPQLLYSLDVNALNYCRFSLLVLKRRDPSEPETGQALIAVPNLVESSLVGFQASSRARNIEYKLNFVRFRVASRRPIYGRYPLNSDCMQL